MSAQQTEPKYFVRSSADGPVKGPFDRDALRKSLDRGLMKPEAEARAEDAVEWVTLKSLFKKEEDAKDSRHEEAEYVRSLAVREAELDAARKASGANVIFGLVLLMAGIGLTFISMQGGGRVGMVFVGLIVVGLIRMVRGLAAR